MQMMWSARVKKAQKMRVHDRPTDTTSSLTPSTSSMRYVTKKKHRNSQSDQEEAYALVLKWACLKTLKYSGAGAIVLIISTPKLAKISAFWPIWRCK